MRFLILAHLNDETALRVYAELRSRHGSDNVLIASNEELVYAPHWMHRFQSGHFLTRIRLADGTVLDSESIGVVFNRLRFPIMPHFDKSSEADKNYAVMEMHSLLLSWLASLPCAVLNPATSRGLAGPERSHAEWICLAQAAQLPVRRLVLSTDMKLINGDSSNKSVMVIGPGGLLSSGRADGGQACDTTPSDNGPEMAVVLVGDQVFGDAPGECLDGLRRLRELSGCELLKIYFSTTSKAYPEWRVSAVTHFFEVDHLEVVVRIADLMELRERKR
jgi:hypothetical protein